MNQSTGFSRKAIVLIFALLLGVVIVLLLSDGGQTTESPVQSSETTNTNNPPDQTAVTYEGFKELANRGMTSFQMQGVRYALFQFAPEANNFKINPASIKTTPYDRDRPQAIIPTTFDIAIDKKAYLAKVDKYNDLTTIRVYLFDDQGKQVYDSKPLDSRKVDAANTAPGE